MSVGDNYVIFSSVPLVPVFCLGIVCCTVCIALPYKRMADNVLDLKANGFSIHCMIERCKKMM